MIAGIYPIMNGQNKMFMHTKVIIIGGNHHNTLGPLRALGRRGIYSDLIVVSNEKSPFVSKSKYIDRLFIIDSDEQILDCLKTNYHNIDNKPVVIACADSISSFLDMHRNELSEHFIIPASTEQGKITALMNKQNMSNLAVSCGLTIPESYILDENTSNLDSIPVPCIIKPLVSKDGSKSDIKVIRNKESISKLLPVKSKIQVQSYITKAFEYQLIGCSLNGGGRCIIPGRTVIIYQPSTTNTAFLRYEPLDGTEPIQDCVKFIKATGYSGLFSMEFLRGVDGKNYFMEINFRNDGNAISVVDAGINLPYIWYLGCTNKNYDVEITPPPCHKCQS